MKYKVIICFLLVFVITQFVGVDLTFSASSKGKPEWVKRGPSYDDENFIITGKATMKSLNDAESYAISDAVLNFINFTYLSYLRKYTMEQVLARYHLQPKNTPQPDDELCKHLHPMIKKYFVQNTYYEKAKKGFTVWVQIFIQHSEADLMINEITKYENKGVTDPTVIIAFRYMDYVSSYRLQKIPQLVTKLTREFKGHKYNIVDNPISYKELPVTKDISRIISHLAKVYKKTDVKRILWCQLNEKTVKVNDDADDESYVYTKDSLLIREINLANNAIEKIIDKRSKSKEMDLGKSKKSKQHALKMLIKKLEIEKKDLEKSTGN